MDDTRLSKTGPRTSQLHSTICMGANPPALHIAAFASRTRVRPADNRRVIAAELARPTVTVITLRAAAAAASLFACACCFPTLATT